MQAQSAQDPEKSYANRTQPPQAGLSCRADDAEDRIMDVHVQSRNRSTRRGAILLDALIGTIILMLSATAFFSVFPTIKRSQALAQQQSSAVLVANRMLEHLQMLRPSDLNETALMQLNLVDGPEDDDGDEWYSFTRVPMDEASGYSPAQMLHGGEGRFRIVDLPAKSKKIELEVKWTWPTGKEHVLKTGTILGGYR